MNDNSTREQPATLDHARVGHLPGRCTHCGFHVKTQGHRNGCHRRAPITPEARKPVTDFIAVVKAQDARDAARHRMVAPPQRPRRRMNGGNLDKWLEATFRGVVNDVATTPSGQRNARLRWGARRLAEISHSGLDEQSCREALEQAARDNGLWHEDGAYGCRASIDSGWTKGIATPQDTTRLNR